MWFENEIEAPAIKSYHLDPWNEEDYETMGVDLDESFADDKLTGI